MTEIAGILRLVERSLGNLGRDDWGIAMEDALPLVYEGFHHVAVALTSGS